MRQVAPNPDVPSIDIDDDAFLIQLIITLESKILEIECQFKGSIPKQTRNEIKRIKRLILITIERTDALREKINYDGRSQVAYASDLP